MRNWLFSGILASSISAIRIASTTASGTAITENCSVFFAAIRKAEFWNSFVKFCRPTKFFEPTPSIRE